MTLHVDHPHGKPQAHQDYEVQKLKLVSSFPTCASCHAPISRDRLAFLEQKKVAKTSDAWKHCGNCYFLIRNGLPPAR